MEGLIAKAIGQYLSQSGQRLEGEGNEMIRHIELIADRGGGFTLQVGKTCRHRYDSARQVADDLLGLVAGEHPLRDWGRNEAGLFPGLVYRDLEEQGGNYIWYEGTPRTVMAQVMEDRLSGCGWHSVDELADILAEGRTEDS